MGFAAALAPGQTRPPLMFEPLPPSKAATPDQVDAHLEALATAMVELPHVEAVNVPQIVGGQFETVDARDYALAVQSITGIEGMVNTIVALRTEPELIQWIQESDQLGIKHLVLVGGESSDIEYPGPNVTRANNIARDADSPGPGPGQERTIGNICIPFRRRRGNDEPDRMVAKTQAGADHFTSQIILEPITTRRLLRDYDKACRHAMIRPATIFIGIAPITDKRDIGLLKHLGVEVPPHVERDLLWEPDRLRQRSLELNLGILRNILDTIRNENISIPVGLNVEQVSQHNWEASIELAREASLLLEEHAWLVEDAADQPEPAPLRATPSLS